MVEVILACCGVLFLTLLGWLVLSALASVVLPPHEPSDGRWCPTRRCGGLLRYQRARIDGAYLTLLSCWRCGAEWVLHHEPEYQDGARPPFEMREE